MRDRRIRLAVAGVLATGLGALTLALPASADLVTACTGSASDVTVPNDLFVPAGQACELTNVTINGNTTVRAGATLLLNDSRLNGNLAVQADGFVSIMRTTVTGPTRLNTAFGGYAENASLGNVAATDTEFFYGIATTINNVVSTNGETFLDAVRLNRNLTTTGDLLTDISNTVIQGTVNITGAAMGSLICASEIDGDASVRGSGTSAGSVVQIGAPAPLSGCAFNVFGGDLALTDNAAAVHVSDNVIRGQLVCTGNSAAPVGSSTRIRGGATGQCAAPAPASAARGSLPARTVDRLAMIRSRVTAGATAARSARAALTSND